MDMRLRFLLVAFCALTVSPFALAEETTTPTETTATEPPATSCDGLTGLKGSLCRHEGILRGHGETLPDCADITVKGALTGVKHAYCTIWENLMRKKGEAAAKEKKLKHKMLKAAKKENATRGKMMKKELKGRMHDALKQKRMEMDEVKSASRKERMKMRRMEGEEGAVLEGARSSMMGGGMEEVELRAMLRANRLLTKPREHMGVRRHTMGRETLSPRAVHETGERAQKVRTKERVRHERAVPGMRKTTEQ